MRPNCDFGEHVVSIFDAFDKFKANGKVKKLLKDPDEAFWSLLQNEFKMDPENLMFQKNIGKGRVIGFQKRLDNLITNIEKGRMSGKMAEMFYTPSAFANTDPTVSKLLNDYIHTSQTYQGTQKSNKDRQVLIKNAIREEAKTRGLMSTSLVQLGKKITFKTAEDMMRKNEDEINRLTVKIKNGDKDSEAKYRDLIREEVRLIEETEMGVYNELIGYVEGDNGLTKLVNDKLKENPKVKWTVESRRRDKHGKIKYFLGESDLSRLLDANGKPISSSVKKALFEYTKLTEDLYWDLRNGVDSYIDTVMEGQSGKTKESLNKMRDSLSEKLMPNVEKGFYPHFRRGLNVDFMDGLMGKLEDLVLSSNKYFNTNISMQGAIDNVNGFVSGHTKSRETNINPEDYSRNFPKVIDAYASNVARFNYINRINLNTKRVMTQLEGLYKDGNYEGGYGHSVMEFIQDLHKSATGYDQIKNPAINNMMRTILGFEFISKIGFNPRSAVRNMSQSLMNLVEWSPLQIKKANNLLESKGMLDEINAEMESIGILFTDSAPELQESMGRTPGGHSSVRLNEATGKMEHVPITRLEKISGITNTIAGKAGWMTAKVENFNRKTTFKIAYSQMYDSLTSTAYYDMIASKF